MLLRPDAVTGVAVVAVAIVACHVYHCCRYRCSPPIAVLDELEEAVKREELKDEMGCEDLVKTEESKHEVVKMKELEKSSPM